MSTPSPAWRTRPVHANDAVGVITLMKNTIAEPVNNLLSEPGEFTFTEEQERVFLAEQGMRPDWAAFVAVTDAKPSQIVGMVMADGRRRRAIRHRASVGLVVAHGWRAHGIGRALMERAIAWARESGVISRLELEVLARNEPAIHLYEQLGFQREGLVRNALLRNGEYLDELTMTLLL